ncbi:phosphotransferase [Aminobacter aminovorans]|uniref:Hydroxylysine kinase n=1 Tax=Aminobacter aminovorans TaxID=83263 RepID=A0AAC8YVD8_AMIAI|nr:phosphotransferase [Aminobacter aminovorans]AMS45110.1 Putative membrane protein [Aminobacter aminovorans]MBB3705135.1 Ser/Thr protein kinase RdoA (MazF antagonist) [Aminobacter aminovorans]
MGHDLQTKPARASELSEACHLVGAAEAEAIAARVYNIQGTATRFETEKDDTFLLHSADLRKFVLKIAHPSERIEELDFQVALLRHIAERAPDLPVPRAHCDIDGVDLPKVTTSAGERRVVRLITFLAGTPLDRTSSTAPQRERIGEVLAKLRHAMAGFSHPADSRTLAWDVTHLLDLSDLLEFIPAGSKRAWTIRALERFAEIKPQLDQCRRQVLHNDFNTSNLVVDPASPNFLTGVIDFGDAVRTAIAVDVSTALMNQMPRTLSHGCPRDLFDEPRDVLRGYLRHADLTDDELKLIPFLAQGRLAVRALLTCWRAELFPENSRYILRNTEAGWAHLEWFNALSTSQISELLTREEP